MKIEIVKENFATLRCSYVPSVGKRRVEKGKFKNQVSAIVEPLLRLCIMLITIEQPKYIHFVERLLGSHSWILIFFLLSKNLCIQTPEFPLAGRQSCTIVETPDGVCRVMDILSLITCP